MKKNIYALIFAVVTVTVIIEFGYLLYLNSNITKVAEKKVTAKTDDTENKSEVVAYSDTSTSLSDFIDFFTGTLSLARNTSKTYKEGKMIIVMQGKLKEVSKVEKDGPKIYVVIAYEQDETDSRSFWLTEQRTTIVQEKRDLSLSDLKISDMVELTLEFDFQKKQSTNIIRRI